MITIKNILIKIVKCRIKAFTLLESMLSLVLITFLAINLSGSVKGIFQNVEERLFFLSFENIYRDSQKLSAAKQETVELIVNYPVISNGYTNIIVPDSIKITDPLQLSFGETGGNSSLAKVEFQSSNRTISYQLYLGSGKYRKAVR